MPGVGSEQRPAPILSPAEIEAEGGAILQLRTTAQRSPRLPLPRAKEAERPPGTEHAKPARWLPQPLLGPAHLPSLPALCLPSSSRRVPSPPPDTASRLFQACPASALRSGSADREQGRFFAYHCRWILTAAGAGLPSLSLRRHFPTGRASPDSGQRRTAPSPANGGPRSSNSSGTLRRRLTPSAPARSASLRPRARSCSPGGGAVDVYFPSWCFFTTALF